MRGPTVMAGYWGMPEATARALSDGWLHTGDVGSIDEDGRLRLSGRREDLIVTGGENVYPAEIEAALESHPAVSAACVVGLPDDEWGAVVAAAIVTRTSEMQETIIGDSCELDTPSLDSFLRERLADSSFHGAIDVSRTCPETLWARSVALQSASYSTQRDV